MSVSIGFPFYLRYVRANTIAPIPDLSQLHGLGEIYCIVNNQNNQRYIGQTTCIKIKNGKFVYSGYLDRFEQHKKNALSNDTSRSQECPKLYQAIREFGPHSFFVILLERCPVQNMNDREIARIRQYRSRRRGYNVTRGGQFGPKGKRRKRTGTGGKKSGPTGIKRTATKSTTGQKRTYRGRK